MALIENEEILAQLKKIEEDNNVKILFACEAGSRAWGFESPDSDYDVRFIYVPKLKWYTNVHVPGTPQVQMARDVIETPISNDLDITGWELRKSLRLAMQSNPALLEWLTSPIIYLETPEMQEFRRLAFGYITPEKLCRHYYGMADRNFHEHLTGRTVRYKKYLYVLRPLLAVRWIRLNRSKFQFAPSAVIPPVPFNTLLQSTLYDDSVSKEIQRLLDIKMASSEAQESEPWPILQAFILSELEKAKVTAMSDQHHSDFDVNGFAHLIICAHD